MKRGIWFIGLIAITFANIIQRVSSQGDPWKDFDSSRTSLPSFDKIEKVLAEK